MGRQEVFQTEDSIHKAIVAYLRAVLPDDSIIMHARNEGNRGGRKGLIDGARGAEMAVKPGWPDLLIYVEGDGFAIEVKRPGQYLSPVQKAVAQELAKQGIPHAVCRSVEDVRDLLAHWGVNTKEKARQRSSAAGLDR